MTDPPALYHEPYVQVLGPGACICSECGVTVAATPEGPVNAYGFQGVRADCPTHGAIYGVVPTRPFTFQELSGENHASEKH